MSVGAQSPVRLLGLLDAPSVILEWPRGVRLIPKPGLPHMIVTVAAGVGGHERGAVDAVAASGAAFDAICPSQGSV